jgi:hypothetical protein
MTNKSTAYNMVLCNWGMMLKQSSAVHIQASYSADVILLGSSYKHQLLIINLALLVGSKHFATLKN